MPRLTISDLEIERNAEPFEITMDDGTVFALRDPKGIEASKLVVLESLSPVDQLRAIVDDDKADDLIARPEVDGYFLEALVRRYMQHFGLGSLPNAAGLPRS